MAASDDVPHSVDQLRILHWNIHSWRDAAGGSNLEAVAELVRETDAHVVSLVEVDESWGSPSVLSELASRLGYASVFVPTFEFGRGEAPTGGFGNALLTKLPISAVRQWQLVWPPTLYDGTEPSEPRSAIFAKLGSVWVGSTHLPRSDAAARSNTLQRLTSLTERLDGTWLLCGDFNIPASSWLDRDSPLSVCPEPAQATYPADEPAEPIDYCVASPGISVQAKVLSVTGSDHLPVLILGQVTHSERPRP